MKRLVKAIQRITADMDREKSLCAIPDTFTADIGGIERDRGGWAGAGAVAVAYCERGLPGMEYGEHSRKFWDEVTHRLNAEGFDVWYSYCCSVVVAFYRS